MSTQDLPQLELFTRLQRAGLPLGMNEYQLLIKALQGGFGIADRAALKRLCRTLWVKSADEDRLFDHHFEQLMPHLAESVAPFSPLETPPEQSGTMPKDSLLSPPTETTSPDTLVPSTTTQTAATSEITVNMDEVQVARSVLQAGSLDDVFSACYLSSDEYFPVTRRQMKQSWRYLCRPIREGPPVELDVDATVKEVGRKGMLLEPVLVPRRINRAELLLLIDHDGSMVPFHLLSHRLIETVLRGGRLGKAGIYYFHNCPVEYLYSDPAHQEYEEIEEILNNHYSQWTGVLVFSDAGAARGGYNPERVDLTKQFLQKFKHQFRYIAWLNPMPHSRWPGTTAGAIMQSVPMFDLSRQGLDDAISTLRGRLPPTKAQMS